jgi:pullulanase
MRTQKRRTLRLISVALIALCIALALSFALTRTRASDTPTPTSVTIPGSLESEITNNSCGDWEPACSAARLTFDADDQVWQGTFMVPAGAWEYKAALNDSWDENYGANAQSNGSNIGLALGASTPVKFYYDHETHWIADNRNALIVTAPGNYQQAIGCSDNWDPSCLRSWLKDPDGDGVYTMTLRSIPAGSYECKAAINESWDINYGEGGVQNGANIHFTVPQSCADVFFSFDSSSHVLTVSASGAPSGDLSKAKAHWVTRDTIAWNPVGFQANGSFALHYAPNGGLALGVEGVSGGVDIPLTYDPSGLSDQIKALFPHLADFKAFKVPSGRLVEVPAALKGQLAVTARDGGGASTDATSLQIPGVLDDLYTYGGRLGVSFSSRAPTLAVWAPTAHSVKLHLFDDSNPATTSTVYPMSLDPATGVWSVTGGSGWNGKYYLYEVEVFAPSTRSVQRNFVTDPYSVSLSKNSQRSQIIDLADALLKPTGWDALVKPPLEAPEDIALYELHVRDFSANDPSVAAPLRGTFKAFTQPGSNGMLHLAALAQAGLTHVHILPSFDIASVNEDKSMWRTPAGDLASYPPDSDQQQAAIGEARDTDAFNWGYDPLHYIAPDGSYATDPDGATRVLEFRQMVKGLSDAGLRLVMDVVLNHTSSAGQNPGSTLDKIVPGYYYRLGADGGILNNSCCPDTASEHNMMEKLLVDSCITWATRYKVDGFRFDLMSFHMKRNMLKLRSALDALTLAQDGVDGSKIYVYGEGWNFGAVGNNARGVNATQFNMAGTGIGTFNDRIRDGVRGGGPFSGIQEQGFLTGLAYDPNATSQGSAQDQDARLLQLSDWLRLSLAGNLATFRFADRHGNVIAGSQLDYNGQPAGYTADPQENISYIDAHDNETLFDAIQFKAATSNSMADRVRMQNLGLSIVALGQGIPFIHAGADMLRSKSLDRNSYNSGDWFNKLDFTYQTNNWGVGLPPAGDNASNWPIMRPLLANPALRPAPSNIRDAVVSFREALAIRKSSKLFRLRTASDVNARVRFYNTGPNQLRGLIVMGLWDTDGGVDRAHKVVVALFNANDVAQTFQESDFQGHLLSLHPVQISSQDPVVRTSAFNAGSGAFVVPARTAAVFVEARPAPERIQLLKGDVTALANSGALTRGQANSLLTKLDSSLARLSRGDTAGAIARLRSFVNHVQSLLGERVLKLTQARPLIKEGKAISGQLCS